eukprot:scaffold1233_cov395-Prasinococcus_capsulatus_cf.AAC.8
MKAPAPRDLVEERCEQPRAVVPPSSTRPVSLPTFAFCSPIPLEDCFAEALPGLHRLSLKEGGGIAEGGRPTSGPRAGSRVKRGTLRIDSRPCPSDGGRSAATCGPGAARSRGDKASAVCEVLVSLRAHVDVTDLGLGMNRK